MLWWKVIGGIFIVGVLGWIGWYVTRPVPGMRVEDQGREHVSVEKVASYAYNSNPPSSGPHLPTWIKPGIYDSPQSEGELIHSLEHGYIIISYNCSVHLTVISDLPAGRHGKQKVISKIYAHEEGAEEGSPSADFVDPTIAPLRQGFEGQATGSAVNESEECTTLVKQLMEVANKKKLWKLIVVPRPGLDVTIALTAWTYLDKFDQFDEKRIERFIDYHRDQGPEKTME